MLSANALPPNFSALVCMMTSCTGVRGGLFTVAMTRLNVRIRTSLFDALMRQEIAFFTSTKTGVTILPIASEPCLHSACIAHPRQMQLLASMRTSMAFPCKG